VRPGVIVGAMRLAAYFLVFALAACAKEQQAESLPRLSILAGSLTVSGVSAGGYMATQYQVAFARDVAGAGIVGAGPWLCAQGLVTRAMDECLEGDVMGPDTAPLIAALRASAAAGAIDSPSWLADDRVWLFHGAEDSIVGPAVSDSLLRFYRELVPHDRLHYETLVPAEHGFPTADHGTACGFAEPPWLLDCDYDAAGELLNYLYGDLRAPSGEIAGELLRFAQSRHASGGRLASLADEGFIFVPKNCAAGETCRLHVAFHGCRQGVGFAGDAFARHAGYNRWADANRIVVLYPQAAASRFWPINPRGCWDWWGYSGANYAARGGLQLSAVHRMVQALKGDVHL
jgi:Esterase PHB depolymerase